MSEVSVNILVSDDAAVARVVVYLDDNYSEAIITTGSAKKHPKDHSVDKVGKALALSRALSEAAIQLEERAMEISELQDRVLGPKVK